MSGGRVFMLCLLCLLGAAGVSPGVNLTVLTEPHRPVVASGEGYPNLLVTADAAGSLVVDILRLDTATHGPIDPGQPIEAVARLGPFELSANSTATVAPPGYPPGTGRYQYRLAFTSAAGGFIRTARFAVISSLQVQQAVMIGPGGVLRRNGEAWLPLMVFANSCKLSATGGYEPDVEALDFTLEHLEATPFGLLDYATPIGGYDYTEQVADKCLARSVPWGLSLKDLYWPDSTGWPRFGQRQPYFPGQSPIEIATELARRLWDHPALAFYYTNDELDASRYPELFEMQQMLVLEDPLHPSLHVHHQDNVQALAECYDMYSQQYYNGGVRQVERNFELMAQYWPKIPPTAGYWTCLGLDDSRIRTMTYGSIASGARAVVYYAFHRMRESMSASQFESRWAGIVEMAGEVQSRAPILLQQAARVQCTTAAADVACRTFNGPLGKYVLIVNGDEDGTRQVFIEVGAGVEEAFDEDGSPLAIVSGRIELELSPYDVYLIELRPAEPQSADLNADGVVNFLDYAAFTRP
jgi:hypothetical protein